MLDGFPVAGLTAPALVSLFVVLLYFGRIVPKARLDEKTEEATRWRLAYEAERDARAAADAQSRELLEVTRTTQAFIKAVFANSERIRSQEENPDETTIPT